jgi:hypothetical protein
MDIVRCIMLHVHWGSCSQSLLCAGHACSGTGHQTGATLACLPQVMSPASGQHHQRRARLGASTCSDTTPGLGQLALELAAWA